MSQSATPEPKAWQPFTPRGVARFAHAPLGRLLAVQLCFSILVSVACIWFLVTCYAPVILTAVGQLPDEAEISKQELRGLSPGLLAQNRFLSIGVETAEVPFSGTGDVEIKLGEKQWKVCSLLGCVEMAYPAGWTVSLSRSTVEPRWGAWSPMIFAGLGLFLVIKLLLSWAVLALLYLWIVKLIAFYADRESGAKGCWRLAGAAQLPGAVFVGLSLLLYGLGGFDLLRFLAFYLLHLPVGWVYLASAPFFLPRVSAARPRRNPFAVKVKKKRT